MSEEEEKEKTAEDIIKAQIRVSLDDYKKADKAIALSAFIAGLEIGFSVLLMGVLYTLYQPIFDSEGLHLMVSLGYPIGFIFVILGRSELFTEQTALAILPVLNGKASLKDLIQFWALIIAGNLAGGALFAVFLSWIGPGMDIISVAALESIAKKMTDQTPLLTLGSAVLAGWMMGLLSWLLSSTKETISKIIIVLLITVIIGIASLHHCIVGSVEVLSGLMVSEQILWVDYGKFLLFSVSGNIVGGAFFVSVLKFSQLKLE